MHSPTPRSPKGRKSVHNRAPIARNQTQLVQRLKKLGSNLDGSHHGDQCGSESSVRVGTVLLVTAAQVNTEQHPH